MIRRLLLSAALAATTALPLAAQTTPAWPEVTREAKPGSRWWWMGSAVDAGNLQRNISEYARTGIGTLEITPIYGVKGNEKNELQYLSSGWMDALKTSQQSGEANGVDIDMNGGTGWPFGGPWVKVGEAAGKLVTKSATQTSDGTSVISFNVAAPEGNAPLNKVMAYQQDGEQVVELTGLVSGNSLQWQAPAGSWLLLAIYNGHTMQEVKRSAPGGEGLVLDHYDAEAVKAYLQHFDNRFTAAGAQWPHTFFNDSYEVYGADWTPKMFEEFEKYRGYKLEEHMDRLLGLGNRKDTGNQVLADYRQTLSDMLLNNFTRQWTQWAHSHGVTTRNQGHGSPGNLIDFYAAVDIPEIEGFGISDLKIKGLRTDPGFTSQNLSDLATLKYASSAAHVTGKKMTSSETFTWLAEHFRVSLSQMKPDLDLMFTAGVNHIFFHGTTYSPQEAAWPGWKFYASIDMSPTNSIWRDAPSLMQYATRCQSFLQMGMPDNDLLVYAPFNDAMHKNTGANAARLQLFDINTLSQKMPSMVTAVNNVMACGLDCDFISDELLLTTTCSGGLLQTAAGTRYKALIVPVSTNLPEATKARLDALAAQGARIVYANTQASVEELQLPGEELRTRLGLRVIRRQNATGHHYFIANLSANDVQGMVSLAVPFRSIACFDPLTGDIREAYTEDGKVWISLRSGQSVILQTYDTAVSLSDKQMPLVEMASIGIDTPWTLSFTDDTFSKGTLSVYPLSSAQTWEQLDEATATATGTGIYETRFALTAQQMQMANGGWRIDLGDVRESARVYINDAYVGCAWSAPFVIDDKGLLRQGDNSLRIEVTNLPANRIRQMDVDGTEWRIFKDVNILDVYNGNTSQANIKYNQWSLVPSGLNGKVGLIPLRQQQKELEARLVGFEDIDGDYYAKYRLTAPTAQAVQSVSLVTMGETAFSDYVFNSAEGLLTVKGIADDYIIVRAADQGGNESETYLSAHGAYTRQQALDFTADAAPLCGWQTMASKSDVSGFDVNTAWRRAPEKNSARQVALAEGVEARSEAAAYYFFYPGYGMNVSQNALLTVEADKGDICMLSYLVGNSSKKAYAAADSLLTIVECVSDEGGIEVPLASRGSYCLYRSLQLYKPKASPSSVQQPSVLQPLAPDAPFYNLQGIPVARPVRGIYIRGGRKYVF